MKISRPPIWIIAASILAVLVLLNLFITPVISNSNSGSTYGRTPDGYAGWYAFMKDRKTTIQRWQKPLQSLLDSPSEIPTAFLRISSEPTYFPLSASEVKWLEKGNILIILGVRSNVTEAPFSTQHKYQNLSKSVKIDTTRREKTATQVILGDGFGAIVWEEKRGKGSLIYATTPYLAANAYQNNSGNYEFLAKLIEAKQPTNIYIDEYMHGHKDAGVRDTEGEKNLLAYWFKTPLAPLSIQGLVIFLIAIWAKNHRFGKALTLIPTTVNNSKAYVDALAAVLQKAESSDFIIEIVGREEQLELQRTLGLKGDLLDSQSLTQAWAQQTGQPAKKLDKLLKCKSQQRHLSEAALLNWMKSWQAIHKCLPDN